MESKNDIVILFVFSTITQYEILELLVHMLNVGVLEFVHIAVEPDIVLFLLANHFCNIDQERIL